METIKIECPTARVLGKLKKGHKVRVAPPKGEGMALLIHPERFNHIARTFSKGKGLHIALSPEEIHHNHAKGIWDTIRKTAKSLGHKAIDAGAKYAPQIATGALSGLALATGQPELLPLAGLAGSYLGSELGKAGSSYAHKELDRRMEPPSRKPSVDMFNAHTGQDMGRLEKATVGKAVADLSLAELEGLIAKKRASMGMISQPELDTSGGRSMSQYADPVGHGLYAQGRGIRQRRHRQEKSSIGIHGNLLGAGLPPALMSQPYSSNFQFSSRLPPAFQAIHKSGSGL